MNKIKSFITDIIKAINKVMFLCAILTLGLVILSPTPIVLFCSGWCTGIFVGDTMHRYINNK